jgi:hypothetical protein
MVTVVYCGKWDKCPISRSKTEPLRWTWKTLEFNLSMRHRTKSDIMKQPPENELYRSDAPVTDPEQDRFGHFPFAQRVAQTVARREDPSSIVVAIQGAWGEGKTTVLAYIDSELQKLHPHVVSVRFNPWRFTDEATLLKSFFGTLADGLKRSLTTRKERVGKVMQEYGKLAALSIEYQGAKVKVGEGIDQLGEYWSTISLDEKKFGVEKVLREEGRRIVVLIDDIDRLERSEIRQIFRLVKLTGDFQYVSYVLAFDPDMVAMALGETYGAGSVKDGASFLEKIVQVPISLPAADPVELQQYCFDRVNEALRVAQVQLSTQSREEFELEFDRSFATVLDTPRSAKRYANALAFIMPLVAGEVNPLDVMLLEALKIFYPSLHTAVRKWPENFTGSSRGRSEADREKAKRWMHDLLSGNSDADRLIMKLFPMVRGVLRDGKFDSGEEVEWSQQQKVASREYLKRYLTCSVPRDDIADRRIEELITQIEGLSLDQASDRFLAFIACVNPKRLLWKLRVRVTQVDGILARHIALVIARSGDGIPGPGEKGALGSPLSSAAFLIRLLLARVEEPAERLAAAREVLMNARPLTFAHLCFQSMRPRQDGLDDFIQEASTLETLLADRIAKFAQTESLLKAFPEGIDWLILLLQWERVQGSEPVRAYYHWTCPHF